MARVSAQVRDSASARQRPGPALTKNDQIALVLIQHLGVDGALRTCDEKHWTGVRKAVERQRGHALDGELRHRHTATGRNSRPH